jgi:hypothetical protein
MRIIKSIWLFYRKLIITSAAMSVMIALVGTFIAETAFSHKVVGLAYIFCTPLTHFLVYEVRNANEYYFYYNLGLSKITLWISTVLLSITIGLILLII